MRRAVGVALTTAALSVTVGVLAGVVITLGSRARAQSAAPATNSSTVAVAAAVSSDLNGLSGEISIGRPLGSALGIESPQLTVTSIAVAATEGNLATGTTKAGPSTRWSGAARTPPARSPSSAPTTAAIHSTPTIRFTTITVEPSTTATPPPPTQPAPTTAATTAATSTAVSSTRTVPPGWSVAPGRPCSALGDKGTLADGSNVFCQHDFANGTLAWRAVFDGGGCLNREMTGIGTDHRRYRCVAGAGGLDHWRRAP